MAIKINKPRKALKTKAKTKTKARTKSRRNPKDLLVDQNFHVLIDSDEN